MIPTVLFLGIVAGLFGMRGLWFVAFATIVFPTVLLTTDVITGLDEALGSAGFAAINAVVGVLVGNGVRGVVRLAAGRASMPRRSR